MLLDLVDGIFLSWGIDIVCQCAILKRLLSKWRIAKVCSCVICVITVRPNFKDRKMKTFEVVKSGSTLRLHIKFEVCHFCAKLCGKLRKQGYLIIF